jgi:hypothetical protein
MQRWSGLLATVLLVPAGLSAQFVVQEGGADTSTISITAVAERAVAADRATVLVQVASEDTAIDAAAVAVGGVRAAVTAALADLGFVEQDAGFWAYAAGRAMQYGRPQPGMSPGFEARACVWWCPPTGLMTWSTRFSAPGPRRSRSCSSKRRTRMHYVSSSRAKRWRERGPRRRRPPPRPVAASAPWSASRRSRIMPVWRDRHGSSRAVSWTAGSNCFRRTSRSG